MEVRVSMWNFNKTQRYMSTLNRLRLRMGQNPPVCLVVKKYGSRPPPPCSRIILTHTMGPMMRSDETSSHKASCLNCNLGNGVSIEDNAKRRTHNKWERVPDHLEDKMLQVIHSQAGRTKEPAGHRKGACLDQSKMIPHKARKIEADQSTPS